MKRVLITIWVVAFWFTPILGRPADDVRLTYDDGTVYLVSDFSFYTPHHEVSGVYFKNTTDNLQPLLVNTGKLWHEVKGEDAVAIRLEPDASKKALKARIEIKGGQTISGTVPLELSETWESGDYFWIEGTTTKFGNPAKFKISLYDIVLVEALKDSPKHTSIKTNKGEEKTAQTVEFGLYGNMPYSYPSSFGLSDAVNLKSEGMDISMPLKDVLSFTFDEKRNVTMMSKDGETGKISFVGVERIYGRLKTGEILFDSISPQDGAKIKSIEFLKQTRKTK
jgi:hypothetical protein